MNFINEAKKIEPEKSYTGHYTFDRPSKYLFVWSRLFQTVISQAGTFLLTGRFHTQESGIYKCEGGCNIPDVGDLVLSSSSCYFDTYRRDNTTIAATKRMAKLISHIVLNWNPNNPVDSMISLAAEFAGTTNADLKEAIEKATGNRGPYTGDALSDFFSWNPFLDAPVDRVYDKWRRITFYKETPEDVDQRYADIDLGIKLREQINQHIKKANPKGWTSALSCSPRRNEKGELRFWINTGRTTHIDGWKSEQDIQNFLNSNGLIN